MVMASNFSSLYRINDLAFGPYIDYWNIDKSDLSDVGYYEPGNETFEVVLKPPCASKKRLISI